MQLTREDLRLGANTSIPSTMSLLLASLLTTPTLASSPPPSLSDGFTSDALPGVSLDKDPLPAGEPVQLGVGCGNGAEQLLSMKVEKSTGMNKHR